MAINTKERIKEEAGSEATCCTPIDPQRLNQPELNSFVAGFKAMGHPVRLRILDILSRQGGQVCVCDLEEQFELSQPTISHHLRVLREAGLVDTERRGTWIYYHVQPERMEQIRSLIHGLVEKQPHPA